MTAPLCPRVFCAIAALAAASLPPGALANPPDGGFAHSLAAAAPHASAAAIDVAARAMSCALRSHLVEQPRTLSLIDYSLPSSQPRLWVFDVAQQRLLFEELVAHGRNSGDVLPMHFSNTDGSLMSSLGVFRTSDTYSGHNGYSLRLEGLDRGFNDHALARAVVIHGAWYVNTDMAKSQGRIGRSWGCPAVRTSIAHQLIDAIRGGSLIVAYYPDRAWLDHSALLGACTDSVAAASTPVENMTQGAGIAKAENTARMP